jgi:hypothetical protein
MSSAVVKLPEPNLSKPVSSAFEAWQKKRKAHDAYEQLKRKRLKQQEEDAKKAPKPQKRKRPLKKKKQKKAFYVLAQHWHVSDWLYHLVFHGSFLKTAEEEKQPLVKVPVEYKLADAKLLARTSELKKMEGLVVSFGQAPASTPASNPFPGYLSTQSPTMRLVLDVNLATDGRFLAPVMDSVAEKKKTSVLLLGEHASKWKTSLFSIFAPRVSVLTVRKGSDLRCVWATVNDGCCLDSMRLVAASLDTKSALCVAFSSEKQQIELCLACLEKGGALLLGLPETYSGVFLKLLSALLTCFSSITLTQSVCSSAANVFVLFSGFSCVVPSFDAASATSLPLKTFTWLAQRNNATLRHAILQGELRLFEAAPKELKATLVPHFSGASVPKPPVEWTKDRAVAALKKQDELKKRLSVGESSLGDDLFFRSTPICRFSSEKKQEKEACLVPRDAKIGVFVSLHVELLKKRAAFVQWMDSTEKTTKINSRFVGAMEVLFGDQQDAGVLFAFREITRSITVLDAFALPGYGSLPCGGQEKSALLAQATHLLKNKKACFLGAGGSGPFQLSVCSLLKTEDFPKHDPVFWKTIRHTAIDKDFIFVINQD